MVRVTRFIPFLIFLTVLLSWASSWGSEKKPIPLGKTGKGDIRGSDQPSYRHESIFNALKDLLIARDFNLFFREIYRCFDMACDIYHLIKQAVDPFREPSSELGNGYLMAFTGSGLE